MALDKLLPSYFNFNDNNRNFEYGTVYTTDGDTDDIIFDLGNLDIKTNQCYKNFRFPDIYYNSKNRYNLEYCKHRTIGDIYSPIVYNSNINQNYNIMSNIVYPHAHRVDYVITKLLKRSNNVQILTKYDGSNKLFQLLNFSASKNLSFLIQAHTRDMYLRKSDVVVDKIKCDVPPTIMAVHIGPSTNIKLYLISIFNLSENNKKWYDISPWPYGNVYNDGNVCTGSTNIAQLTDYKNYLYQDNDKLKFDLDLMIEMCYQSFFSTIFNNDLSRHNISFLKVKSRKKNLKNT